ncbi:hypothetical protein D3C81_1962560 [compost metagenome]
MALAGRGHADRPVLVDQERRFVVPDRLLGQIRCRVGDLVGGFLLVGEQLVQRIDAGRGAGDDRGRAVRGNREHPCVAHAVRSHLLLQLAPLLCGHVFAFLFTAGIAA